MFFFSNDCYIWVSFFNEIKEKEIFFKKERRQKRVEHDQTQQRKGKRQEWKGKRMR